MSSRADKAVKSKEGSGQGYQEEQEHAGKEQEEGGDGGVGSYG